MIKKGAFIVILASFLSTCFWQLQIPWDTTIYNDNLTNAINANGINNPIRDGAYKIVNAEDTTIKDGKISWLVSSDTKISSHQTAEVQTMNIVKNIINYALWLLSFVALIYLIYHGMLVLTAAGDETQYKKWLKWINLAAIAIWGIGLSWIIISFIFYIINGAITGKF